ncbi:vitamin K epoxide reductase family protein [Phenylobacterium sp.]|uniref:vitamin K epoxide reductase family protein n=1 Tax=Phenylobacterium sp. TaxID=1871053 RepID=UPI0027322899|nr:vitamin K epoxide reductase family protein [Phenylobacterium sp.]MDP2215536.1 NAD-dependent epimerase/dehydratase family protein [Phenylobacterium sp.]
MPPTAAGDSRSPTSKPLVLITGAAGNLGAALAAGLADRYQVVGLDLEGSGQDYPLIEADLTSDDSVAAALSQVRRDYGARLASVIHLAAYFDFTGEDHPLYQGLNVEGTGRLLGALQDFQVEQFIYASTMLVHAPVSPGEHLDETQPLDPQWIYPRSKAAAEAAVAENAGSIPFLLLRLAGVYDDRTAVPTLSHQIARIYGRDLESHLYSGDTEVGQSMLHKDDMVDAFVRAVDRRDRLPGGAAILIGEAEAVSYQDLQDQIGQLIHGEDWLTLQAPKPIAAAGAWAQEKLEAVIPDALDQGEKPFIRPFMVQMADDHYALDIGLAAKLLDWRPRHHLKDELPHLIAALKEDPEGWRRANGVPVPAWMEAASAKSLDAEDVRRRHETAFHAAHGRQRWAQMVVMGLGAWLVATPPIIGLDDAGLTLSQVISGLALMTLGALALNPRLWLARWGAAAVGLWVMVAPILFWSPSSAAFLNSMLVGGLTMGLAVGFRPDAGVSPVAELSGPATPPGWSYNPSTWAQRLPIIALAMIGLFVSLYMAAYQLGHIDRVWDPFFAGGPDPRNGTEAVITSDVSRAWPVPDAAVGALVYALEIVTGLVGSRRRWRTMPWLVIAFGLLIVPLGAVSIAFIIIQPIIIGTWCALCLIGAAAMLLQIPYAMDELLASLQFLARRKRAGQPVLRTLLMGDTDEGQPEPEADPFDRPLPVIIKDMASGGVSLPWNLALAALIGAWLMFTRLTLDAEGMAAHADHVIGALALTVVAIAAAEVTRTARLALPLLGTALIVSAFTFESSAAHTTAAVICGLALIALAFRRGPIGESYGGWSRWIH